MNETFLAGLIITGICIGVIKTAVYGWLFFGIGLMSYTVIVGAFNYLENK